MKNRRILFAALVAALPLVSVANAPVSNAATCVGARTWIDGSQSGNYDCSKKDFGDICAHHDQTAQHQPLGVDRTGAGVSACVNSPVLLR